MTTPKDGSVEDFACLPWDLPMVQPSSPLLFHCSSSHCQKNQLYPLDSSLDKRSKRAKLRKESQEKAPEVLLKVLDEALKHCPLVSTILLASWFSFSSLIQQRTTRGLSVVGRLKNTPKIYYSLGGKALSLSSVAVFSKDFCPLLNSQSHSYGI